MRGLVVVVLAVALAAPALAQRRGGGGFGGGMRGGGGMGFRGPAVRGGGGFGFRGPAVRVTPRWGGAWGGGWGRGWGRGFSWGFGAAPFWPGWWGGGFVSGFSTPIYSDPWPAVYPVYSYAPAPAAPPVVIINQTPPAYEPLYIERRVERVVEPAADEPYRPITYEIAFKDGRELTALAYWVRERTLNYVTRDFAIHQAPLDTVDRARSRELNRPNGIGLRLPPER